MDNVIDTSAGLAGVLERLNRRSVIDLLEQIVQEINEHDRVSDAKRIEELTKLGDELKAQIAALSKASEEQAARVEALSKASEEQASRLDALSKASEEQASRLDALSKTSEEQASRVEALSKASEEQASRVDALSKASEEQASRVDKNLAELQRQLNDQQAGFDARVGEIAKNTLDASQAAIAAQVSSSLEARVASLAQSVANLNAQGGGQTVIDPCTIDNGSFEAGPDPTDRFLRLRPGDSRIKGWTIRKGTVDYIDESYWRSADSGYRSIDLNTDEKPAGSIEQVLSTIVGARYIVTFACAGNPAGAPAVKTLRVTANGEGAVDYSFDTTGKSITRMSWTDKLYAFTATSSSTVLSFESTTPGAYGPVIDHVRIERARG